MDRSPLKGPSGGQRVAPVRALIEAWLRADFFGGSDRRGSGAPLVTALAFQSFCSSLFAILLFTELPDVDFYLATLVFCGVLTALTVLGDLGAVLRDPRHARIVAHLPVRAGELALARLGHAGIYLALAGTAVALPPAILTFWIAGGNVLAPVVFLLVALHQAFLFGFLVAGLQGVFGGRGPGRWLSWLQIALVIGALLLFFLGLSYLPQLSAVRHSAEGYFAAIPSSWFTAELAYIIPTEEVIQSRLAWAAPAWVLTAILVPLIWKGLCGAGADEEGGGKADRAISAPRLPWRALLAPRASRTERGAYDFTLAMLSREREFRLRAYPLLGFPFAMLAAGLWSAASAEQALYLNLVVFTLNAYLPMMLSFLEASPHHRAAWVFHVLPLSSREHVLRGIERALIAHLFVPLYLGLLVVYVALRPFEEGMRQVLVAFLVALVLLPRSLGIVLQHPPFSRPPQSLQAVGLEGGNWSARMFALALILSVVSYLAYRYMVDWTITAAVALPLLICLWWLYGIRRPTFFEPEVTA